MQTDDSKKRFGRFRSDAVRNAILDLLEKYHVVRPDPDPSGAGVWDGGASRAEALTTDIAGMRAETRQELFSLGCVSTQIANNSRDFICIDIVTGKSWYVVKRIIDKEGSALYGAVEAPFILVNKLAVLMDAKEYIRASERSYLEHLKLPARREALKGQMLETLRRLPDSDAEQARVDAFFQALVKEDRAALQRERDAMLRVQEKWDRQLDASIRAGLDPDVNARLGPDLPVKVVEKGNIGSMGASGEYSEIRVYRADQDHYYEVILTYEYYNGRPAEGGRMQKQIGSQVNLITAAEARSKGYL